MSEYLFPLLGIAFAFVLIKYREPIGDVFGDPEWVRTLGGIHYVIVYIAIFIIIWSVAELTGTTSVLFRPLLFLFPTVGNSSDQPDLNY